jgi:uncharacterized protein DUF4375
MATSIDDVLQIADPTQFSIALSELVAQSPRGFAESRPAERIVWCVSALEAEVNNGGFSLFFTNSAGDLATETVDALGRIGAHKTVALLKEAMAVFPAPGPSAVRGSRETQLEALPPTAQATWDRLDQAFFAYPDDLPSLMRAFVKTHAADFR